MAPVPQTGVMSEVTGGAVLVVGATGLLGGALVGAALERGERVVATWHRSEPLDPPAGVEWVPLELGDSEAIDALVAAVDPGLVINAAYVEAGPDLDAITAVAPGNLAGAAQVAGARLVHVSTDVVHDGTCGRTYLDMDVPNPITAYGRAKADAERRVRRGHGGALVARTSLIMAGPDRPAGRHEQLVAHALAGATDAVFFTDELRCPVQVDDLAHALLELDAAGATGILNVAGPEVLSRAELAALVAHASGADPTALRTGPTPDHLAGRPRCIHLDSSAAAALLPPGRLRSMSAVFGQGHLV